jgi:RNA polymerase sigma-70 factor (ECF subfamily)
MDTFELIEKAKNGDKNAFGELYNELYTPLYRFVLSRSRDKEKTLDICQDVFVRWYNSMDTYEAKIHPKSYLMMIATRLMINDSKKKSSVQLPEDADEFIADEADDIQDVLDFEADVAEIKDLFQYLNEDQQSVLNMRYVSDLDTETIAEALEKTTENIRQIESRALRKLRNLYKEKYAKN